MVGRDHELVHILRASGGTSAGPTSCSSPACEDLWRTQGDGIVSVPTSGRVRRAQKAVVEPTGHGEAYAVPRPDQPQPTLCARKAGADDGSTLC